jgi:hypothetical protein
MKPEMKAIWEEVKANHARLDSCPGPHKFPPFRAKLNDRYVCETCNGAIDSVNRIWYERGLQHGSRACGAKLTWTAGEDGWESTCSDCGSNLVGLLDSPELYPVCREPRKRS